MLHERLEYLLLPVYCCSLATDKQTANMNGRGVNVEGFYRMFKGYEILVMYVCVIWQSICI